MTDILNGGCACGAVRSEACGSLLTIRVDFQPDTIDIAAATLDQPEGVAPGFHIFCGDAIPWALLDDGLPRHEKFRPDTRGLNAR
jgi:hypothetical protein